MTAFGPQEPADADRFAQMLREHLPRAGRLAVRLCGDVHAAEDVLGEAMLRAVRGRASYRSEAAFGTWLYAIVVNAFRDSLRTRDSQPMLRLADHKFDQPQEATGALRNMEAAELGQRVAGHIQALPPRQREALVLTVYEDLSADQAAAVMETTATNVRVLVHHARQRLKLEMADLVETEHA